MIQFSPSYYFCFISVTVCFFFFSPFSISFSCVTLLTPQRVNVAAGKLDEDERYRRSFSRLYLVKAGRSRGGALIWNYSMSSRQAGDRNCPDDDDMKILFSAPTYCNSQELRLFYVLPQIHICTHWPSFIYYTNSGWMLIFRSGFFSFGRRVPPNYTPGLTSCTHGPTVHWEERGEISVIIRAGTISC